MNRHRLVAIALTAARLASCAAPSDGALEDVVVVSSEAEALAAGDVIERDHFDAGKGSVRPGVDPRFEDVNVDGNAKDPVTGAVRVFDEPGRGMQVLNDLICE